MKHPSDFEETNIKIALEKFGLDVKFDLQVDYLSLSRYEVLVDDIYFGIWDAEKQTFVD